MDLIEGHTFRWTRVHEPTLRNEKLYSDARCHIPGVATVKQSQLGTPLSDTYNDARCHIPGMTMEKQKNI